MGHRDELTTQYNIQYPVWEREQTINLAFPTSSGGDTCYFKVKTLVRSWSTSVTLQIHPNTCGGIQHFYIGINCR